MFISIAALTSTRSSDLSCRDFFCKLLDDNHLDYALTFLGETPLHTACKDGNLQSVKEILISKPFYARSQNSSTGFSPFHLAAANGHTAIVRELLNFNKTLCFVKDNEGRNPLHCATIAGEIDVVREILSIFPLKELVNSKDRQGNTILHMATAKRNLGIVELLLRGNPLVEINSVNGVGFTALDISNQLVRDSTNSEHEVVDLEIQELIQQAGGLRALEFRFNDSYKKLLEWSIFGRTSSSFSVSPNYKDRSNRQLQWTALLTVAVIIAGQTFHTGLNPPNVVYREENKSYKLMLFRLFMFCNSAGFFASLALVILSSFQLAPGQALLLFSVFSMVASYVCSVITLARSAGYDAFVLAIPLLIFISAEYVLLLKKNAAKNKKIKEKSEMAWSNQKFCSHKYEGVPYSASNGYT